MKFNQLHIVHNFCVACPTFSKWNQALDNTKFKTSSMLRKLVYSRNFPLLLITDIVVNKAMCLCSGLRPIPFTILFSNKFTQQEKTTMLSFHFTLSQLLSLCWHKCWEGKPWSKWYSTQQFQWWLWFSCQSTDCISWSTSIFFLPVNHSGKTYS